MKNIKNLRKSITTIDSQILDLIQDRLKITHEIGILKAKNNEAIFVPEREKEILKSLQEQFPAEKSGITSLWRELMYISKRDQNNISKQDNAVIKIGIQGGKWSFNDIAIQKYLLENPFENPVEICYLFTTEAVLEALNGGAIDFGQFALANSIGGIVQETITRLGNYRWKQVTNYHIAVKHSIFLHPDADISEIDTIMGHEQAIRQCEENLEKNYPKCTKIGGSADLTDNASIAEAVASGALPKTTAAIGHESLAELYNLIIHEKNIQDRDDNETTFVLVNV